MEFLKINETLDDLQLKGIKVIQKKDGFRFGVDAVLLANFANVKKNHNVVDLCSGTGIIPFILAGKTECSSVTGIEIQEDMVEMAKRTSKLNNLEERIKFVNENLTNLKYIKSMSKVDVVTVNPPYKLRNAGIVNPEDKMAIARHEICCNLEDVIISAKTLLKDRGRFYMVHRPERLVDILTLMRQHKLEPKRIRMIHPSANKAPNIVLIEGQRDGGKFFKWEDPLYVHNEDGSYTKEIEEIYNSHRKEKQNG
ncbi:SAM-dependent methyltransferase [Clostridiaceae bacterium 14S0207]|nr:SAM-dependent methyltransferase [Clostridiaceae bacterium 14S0207]